MAEQTTFLSLLQQKRELLFQLLRAMNDTVLDEEDAEVSAENYIELVDNCEGIISELKELDSQLGELADANTAETDALKQEIRAMAEQITRQEQAMRKQAQNVSARLQQELKSLSNSKKLHGAYEAAMYYDGD